MAPYPPFFLLSASLMTNFLATYLPNGVPAIFFLSPKTPNPSSAATLFDYCPIKIMPPPLGLFTYGKLFLSSEMLRKMSLVVDFIW